MAARNYFNGKRIFIIGLGPHGEMVEDAKYLIKAGALVSIYDLKSEARVKNHLIFLRTVGLANYVVGSMPVEDLLDADLIVLSHEYSRESSFLEKVREKGIPIEYPETLFFKIAPPLTIIGVIGTAGKSTLVSVLAPMIESVCENEDQNFFVVDFESGNGILPNLKKAKNGDIMLIKIPDFLIQEFANLHLSPHIAIYTNLPSQSTFKESPFEILAYQTYNNFLIASNEIVDMTRRYEFKPRSKMLRTNVSIIPPIWDFILYEHDRHNIALALQAARLFKVSDDLANKIMKKWKPLKHHIEYVKKIKGVDYYDDSAAISPLSTIAAIEVLSKKKKITLICGGAQTEYSYDELRKTVREHVETVILLPGSGTLRERQKITDIEGVKVINVPNIEEAVRIAKEMAKIGDIVLYSPAFRPLGHDNSLKERGERFIRALRTV